MKIYLLVVFILSFTRCFNEAKKYNNYSLYDLYATERYQLNFLQNLEYMKYINTIFWTRPYKLHTHIQVLVNPVHAGVFDERLQHYSMKKNVISSDIQQLFDKQLSKKYTKTKPDSYEYIWDSYHSLQEMYVWMKDISKKYKKFINLLVIGRSVEGKEIIAVEVFKPKSKAKVMLVGAIHGNEWITAEYVMYVLNELIKARISKRGHLKELVNKYDWILVPVLNPDGYEYSMKEDPLWSKSTRKFKKGQGVDLNKNFNYNFCRYGASNSSDSSYYCGPTAFSEPESVALSQLIKLNSYNLKYFFSIRSYGQKIVIPYSDRIKHLDNFFEMENYGKHAIMKMFRMTGSQYKIGTIYDVYGIRESGDVISWVKKSHKVKYVLAMYLRDNGTFGYALPAEMILPTCQETEVGMIELMTASPAVIRLDFSTGAYLRSGLIHCIVILLIFI